MKFQPSFSLILLEEITQLICISHEPLGKMLFISIFKTLCLRKMLIFHTELGQLTLKISILILFEHTDYLLNDKVFWKS